MGEGQESSGKCINQKILVQINMPVLILVLIGFAHRTPTTGLWVAPGTMGKSNNSSYN